MKFIQPYPVYQSDFHVSSKYKVECIPKVRFLKYRYPHHAAPSGYDRICDYVIAPTAKLPKSVYWLGETFLRPTGMGMAKFGGVYEYSRYDFTMELAVALDFVQHLNCIYHPVYAKKVTHDVPSYTIVGGVPARTIRERHPDIKHFIEWNPWVPPLG